MESSAAWIDISGFFRGVHTLANPRWLVGQPLWWEVAPLWGNGCVSIVNVLKSCFGQSESLHATGDTDRQRSSRGKTIFSTLWRHNMGLLPKTSNCGCAYVGNAGNVFPATAGKQSRHASRHVLDARAAMHAGIANSRFPLKSAAGEYVPGACATRNFTYLVRGPWKQFWRHDANVTILKWHLKTTLPMLAIRTLMITST